ncbi:TPA: serine acetyltransferase [Klebsiella variicola subsp. variicola]|uniref:serine acetyltransferase n=1 Tax=Klebsiella variicola TaxID=244366 RepID=UPI0035A3373A|nr:serine acetyltransferase [Klebsiella variicola subsp. variicola]
MQNLKIEYQDGKLVELSIDGVSFLSASAISFSHTANETLPTIILTMSVGVGVGERLEPPSPPRENLRIIEK